MIIKLNYHYIYNKNTTQPKQISNPSILKKLIQKITQRNLIHYFNCGDGFTGI